MTIECKTHGLQTSGIVCCHHVQSKSPLGFVENSSEPDDLQAWCDDCERMFVQEGSMTAAFLAFNDFAVVCDEYYVAIKTRHSRS